MLNISQKIIISFTILIIISFSSIAYSYYIGTNIHDLALEMGQKKEAYSDYTQKSAVMFNEYTTTINVQISFLDLGLLDKTHKKSLAHYEELTLSLQSFPKTENQEIPALISETIKELETLRDKEIELYGIVRSFAQERANTLYTSQIIPIEASIKSKIQVISNLYDQQYTDLENNIHNKFEASRKVVLISMVVLFTFSGFLALFLWFQIFVPMSAAIDYLKNVEQSNFFNVPFTNRNDEIGELTRSFQNILIAKESAQAKLREQAKDLIKSKNKAEKASNAKSDFLANMSHELRTPLNSIIGMAQLIKKNELDKAHAEMFELITNSSNNLLDIVNDILDLSKIESGEVELEYMNFDAIAKARHTTRALLPIANEKGLELSFETDTDYLYSLGDALRYSRIITNLVSNAIRYTKEGNIKVCLNVKKLHGDLYVVRCDIKDTGIGIPGDKVARIFEKFTQGDSSITRKFGGTGLGLTITKQLVELMDGRIGVDSVEGVGSTFWFEIPFETVKEAPSQSKTGFRALENDMINDTALSTDQVRILVAEDHTMNQVFMRKLFESLGITQYKIVENGQLALKEVEANNYDVVLMDCHMPEMNGYDATINIRALPDPLTSEIPIIAMTANAMPEDEEKCLSIGMDAYISKPVKIDIFKTVLSPWIHFSEQNHDVVKQHKSEQEGPQESSKPPIDLSNLKGNSMGDDDFMREMIALFVSQGEEQIQELKEHCTEGPNNEWVEVSHSLKGTAGGVGAENMRELCAHAQNIDEGTEEQRGVLCKRIEAEYMKARDYFIQEGLYDVTSH